jgi:hypothetical protein
MRIVKRPPGAHPGDSSTVPVRFSKLANKLFTDNSLREQDRADRSLVLAPVLTLDAVSRPEV